MAKREQVRKAVERLSRSLNVLARELKHHIVQPAPMSCELTISVLDAVDLNESLAVPSIEQVEMLERLASLE